MRLNKSGGAGSKAWNLLRASLLWARKGSMFRRRMATELRVIPRFIKSLGQHRRGGGRGARVIWYGERELSFGETPIFNMKMRRPGSMHFHLPPIPCINPSVDFDFDFDEDRSREESLNSSTAGGDSSSEGGIEIVCSDEECIDTRAEEFIANFHQQMMLQRQLSYLRYKERLERGAC